ncbi:sensor histidine kinase [Dictyobacter vulcani]|uniref:histidine kinase n=1 Tax=Dictyobacter vulcani TaxID=2607529 RepID=A0A5J4L0F9_9CHLR|nr:PAS domain S-box protein [Dictyobacter vulcani]GER91789.1 sensor histidine kinase [Dictyobacter vulcani]
MSTAVRTRTVLLIEDNPEDRAIIRRYLSHDPKQTYTLVEVSRGEDGLRAYQETPLDVILLDYYLPDMDGRVFLEALQQKQSSALLPVVVITGHKSEDLALESLRRGAVEYITKDGLTAESLRLALHSAVEKGILHHQVEKKQQELEQTNALLREQQAQLCLALEAAHKQKQAFQMIAENSPDIIARIDHNLRYCYVNPAATTITGLTAAEFSGKNNRELGMPPTQVEAWDTALKAAFATGEIQSIDFNCPSPNGLRWFQAKMAPERDQTGEVVSVLTVTRDVTDLWQAQEDLHRSETRARHLLESNIIGVAVAQGRKIIEANDALLNLIGAQRAELNQVGIDWVDITPVEYKPLYEQALHELQTRGVCTPFEKEYIHRDGSRVPVLLGAATIQQDPLQWVSFMLDLTTQKQVEHERTRALAAFQALAEHSPDVITRFDAATFRLQYANPALEPILGIPVKSMIGKKYWDIDLPRELCTFFDQALTEVVTTGQPTQITFDFRDRYYLALLVPEEDAAHQLSSVLVIGHDITEMQAEHQQTEEALQALIAVAQALVASPEQPSENGPQETQMWVHTAQRLLNVICCTFNCTVALMMALVPGIEVIDKIITSGFDPATDRFLQEKICGQRFSQRFEDATVPARLRTGEVVALDVSQPPYREQRLRHDLSASLFVPMRLGRTLVGVIVLYAAEQLHEFTPEERVQAAAMGNLAALLIERERFFIAHEEAHARELVAQEAARQMDAFLGIVSHELKTPLTSIKANVQLSIRQLQRLHTQSVDQNPIKPEPLASILELLERAKRQLDKQNRLVNDLLDISRIQADRLELQVSLCDMVQVVQEAVEDQRMLTPARQIDLHTSDLELPVFADAGRLAQVVTNYLTNALKYSEADMPVEVHLSIEGQMARVAVSDRGPGLMPDQLQHIWERFYQVAGITVKSGSGIGLGLGLHISKQLIERQGGQVGVDSIPGQGSTFWLTLPRASSSSP